MGSHDPFGHFKHKLWPKEASKIKLTIWHLTTKSQKSPNFLTHRWLATYFWKVLDESYNFVVNPISIKGLHIKLWAPKVVAVGISKLPFGSPKTKWHLGVGHVARHKVYYKGEGGGFPQIQIVVSFVNSCLPMARPCTKVLQLRINELVVWFMQVCVNKWIAYQSS